MQQQAVLATEGPLLLLAGAGSGKRGERADQGTATAADAAGDEGLKKRRFTPKMAGSVMPMKADRAEGSARP